MVGQQFFGPPCTSVTEYTTVSRTASTTTSLVYFLLTYLLTYLLLDSNQELQRLTLQSTAADLHFPPLGNKMQAEIGD